MNILLISVAAPPKITGAECLQVGKFIKYISANNRLSLVTTVSPHNHWQKKDESLNSLLEDVDHVIALHTVSTLGKYTGFLPRKIFKSQFEKPDVEFLFHHQAPFVHHRLKSEPDIIYSRSAPFSSAVMALKMKERLKKPWVMHMSDPWAERTFDEPNSFIISMEEKCLRSADRISFTTPETEQFYKRKYPDLADKFFVCPNVFDGSEVVPEKSSFSSDKVRLLYSGELYGRRTVSPIVKSLKQIEPEKQKLLDVTLIGNMDERNRDMLREAKLNCLKHGGVVAPDESYRRQRDADILLSIDHEAESELDKVYLPSKIQDYLAARRFILAITSKGSAVHRVVGSKYGACFDHSEEQDLLTFWNGLIQAFTKNDNNFLKLAQLGREFEAKHNVDLLLGRFEEVIAEN